LKYVFKFLYNDDNLLIIAASRTKFVHGYTEKYPLISLNLVMSFAFKVTSLVATNSIKVN